MSSLQNALALAGPVAQIVFLILLIVGGGLGGTLGLRAISKRGADRIEQEFNVRLQGSAEALVSIQKEHISELQAANAEKTERLARLEGLVTALEATVARLQASYAKTLSDRDAENTRLRGENALLREERARLTETVARHEQKITALNTTVAGMESEMQTMKAGLDVSVSVPPSPAPHTGTGGRREGERL